MATPIKFAPVLEGEDAVEFILRAEENAKKPTPHLSEERIREIEDVLERSKRFKFEE